MSSFRPTGRKRPLPCRPWSTISDLKSLLAPLLHVPPPSQRLYFGPSPPLPNNRTLQDVGVYRSGETILFDVKGSQPSTPTSSASPWTNPPTIKCLQSLHPLTPKSLHRLLLQSSRGLQINLAPQPTLDGSGGAYLLRSPNKEIVAVYKPTDEEPYAPNNPRGYTSTTPMSLRSGINPGEAAYREVAAFLLDHGGFAGVPETTLAEARHPSFNVSGSSQTVASGGASLGPHALTPTQPAPTKLGSFQRYVPHRCTLDDISPTLVEVDEIHKIAILDIRILNADRNASNLLAVSSEKGYRLTPIDHGFSLRRTGDVTWADWCWLDWPQLSQPCSKHTLKYVRSLDLSTEVPLLRDRLNIPDDALDLFRASTLLLQSGLKAGLNLRQIATLSCRLDTSGEVPSALECLVASARDLAEAAISNERYSHRCAADAIVGRIIGAPGWEGTSGDESSEDDDVFVSGMDKLDLEDGAEEWAAEVVAMTPAGEKGSPPWKRQRSGSTCSVASTSSSNSQGSPQGFWCKRPSSPVRRGSLDFGPGSPPRFNLGESELAKWKSEGSLLELQQNPEGVADGTITPNSVLCTPVKMPLKSHNPANNLPLPPKPKLGRSRSFSTPLPPPIQTTSDVTELKNRYFNEFMSTLIESEIKKQMQRSSS